MSYLQVLGAAAVAYLMSILFKAPLATAFSGAMLGAVVYNLARRRQF